MTELEQAELTDFQKLIEEATEDLNYPDVKDFVTEALQTHGCIAQLIDAIKVKDCLLAMLAKQKLCVPGQVTTLVEVMKASALLFNMFYTEDDFWPDLFTARMELKPIADKHTVADQIQDAIYQSIEAQMGVDTPVPACRPTPNTPTELFAWAVWFVREYSYNEEGAN